MKIISLFLIWRFLLFFIAAVAPVFLKNFNTSFPYHEIRLLPSKLPYFIWSFGNFDGVHYLGIAQEGYKFQYTQTFFPVYPLLIKFIAPFTMDNLVIAGLLISNLSFLISLIIFYQLIKKNYNEKIATWSCLFLLAFPTSFYFGSIYTEGLFFLLIITTFYFYQTKKENLAILIGIFASATRLTGFFLLPALVAVKNKRYPFLIFLIPLGLLAYMIYLKIAFNNPLYFLTAQNIFGQGRLENGIVLLPQVFWRYIKILSSTSGFLLLNASFELLSTIFAIVLLIIFYKKVKVEWLIFSFLTILTPTLTGTLASMPRYILVAFPIYIILAHIKNILIKIIILVISISLLVLTTALFTRGYWVA